MSENMSQVQANLALGAIVGAEEVTFRVWAPRPERVELVLHLPGGDRVVQTEREGEYRVARVADAGAGTRYRYRLDGEGPFPDPCSRSQPGGVHGASEVVDPAVFRWTDDGWEPPAPADLVIYECHIGTLTPEGTFDAAIGQLGRLRDLGMNAIEIMPVSSSPGRWNWGYDGVAHFAPSTAYCGPEGLRRLVDAAHRAGLAVIMDVIYNHFGPDGNYTGLYSDHYVTEKHHTPWGAALNFDDAGSAGVRRFVVENLVHFVREYHVDGFRLDATFAMVDTSARHILAEIADTLAEQRRTSQRPYLIAETDEHDERYLRPTGEGGYGFDATWADDFHHAVRTIIQPERQGYLAKYAGNAEELARTLAQGFLHEAAGAKHDRPWPQYLYCIQNHDQVGNRAFGQRLNVTSADNDFLAASLLLLLLPQMPLLFQGQEFLASTPFLFFTDHNEELGRLVTEGRRKEFAGFAQFSDPAARERIPDPQDPRTFQRSKLNLDEAAYGAGLLAQDLYRAALQLRATDPVLVVARRDRPPLRATARDKAVLVELATDAGLRLIAVNFGDEVAFPYAGAGRLATLLHTSEPRFGGNAVAPGLAEGRIVVAAHSAAFFGPGKSKR
jgi:maltooligosyltrehalose trehalohydrolase